MKLKFSLLIIVICILSVFFFGKNHPPSDIIDLLENNYANLEINFPDHKLKLITELKKLDKDQLKDFNTLKPIIQKMNDGHLKISNTNARFDYFDSGIEFLWDKDFYLLKAPGLKESDLTAKIIAVDNLPIKRWIDQVGEDIFASTDWGRTYKALFLLKHNPKENELPKIIKLKTSKNKNISYQLKWQKSDINKELCVDGSEINKNTFKLDIKTLWCQRSGIESRQQILKNFKDDFDKNFSRAFAYPNIIIDLRSNTGGGESEVIHAISHTISKATFLETFQYLNSNIEFPMNLVNRLNSRWQKPITEHIQPVDKNIFSKGSKNIVVLIDQGCSSSCEVMANIYKAGRNYPLFGHQTHGTTGEPLNWVIPNTNITITYPSLIDYKQDGSPFEGIGVHPSEHKPFVIDGSDPILQQALIYLGNQR